MENYLNTEEAYPRATPQMRSLWSPNLITPNATSERNAQESPLLKLPGELRNKIWNYVLGDRTLHIEHTAANDLTAEGGATIPGKIRLYNRICLCRQTDQEAAKHLMDPAWEQRLRATDLWPNHMGFDLPSFPSSHPLFVLGNPFFVRSFTARHIRCFKTKENIEYSGPISWGLNNADSSAWNGFGDALFCDVSQSGGVEYDSDDESIDEERPRDLTNRGLSLCCLRVCRQIYTEARHLPYSSNTFAFRNTSTYQFFTPSLLPKQRRLITKLNLLVTDVLINSDEQLHWGAWSRAIPSAPLLGDLITDLHINHDISYKKSYVLKTIGPISAPGPPAYLELRFQVMRAMGLSPNCKITSIVADTAKSAWSYQSWPRMPIELRYSRFGGSERRWRRLREHGCLTVGEKRQITIWINKVCGTKRGHKGRDKPSDDE